MGKPVPHIVKIDVEGAALEVLLGAIEIIRVFHPTLIIEVHTWDEHDSVLRILQSSSYSIFWNIPPEGFPRQCVAFGPSSSLKSSISRSLSLLSETQPTVKYRACPLSSKSS
jgi:hypothetical protein